MSQKDEIAMTPLRGFIIVSGIGVVIASVHLVFLLQGRPSVLFPPYVGIFLGVLMPTIGFIYYRRRRAEMRELDEMTRKLARRHGATENPGTGEAVEE